MAKLAAHGAEIIRIARVFGPEADHDSDDGLTQTQTLAFMADGFILVKTDARYVSEFGGQARYYAGHWARLPGKNGKPRTFHALLAKGEREARRTILHAYCADGAWSPV